MDLRCAARLAAALRLGHVLALRELPLFDRLILDSEFYDAWAQRLAAGDWLDGNRASFFDPLYPYFLAAVYGIFGRDLFGTCALVAAIGRRAAGPAVGNLAALLMAVHAPAIF